APGGRAARAGVRAQRRRDAEARHRPHARLRYPRERPLRQHAHRRRHHRRERDRLDRLRALVRRPDHRAAPGSARDRAHLRAHPLGPPDRRVGALGHRDRAARATRHPRERHPRRRDTLLAGGRAGPEAVRHGAERAEITCAFELAGVSGELRQWLAEQAIGGADELIVRRVVGADGRSRAYLNGQAVPLQVLREAGELLIDIHGQHEFQSLTRSAAQRVMLDEYGSLTELTSQVGIAHRAWLGLLNRTLELESKARDRDTRLELLRYQAQELEALKL